MTEKVAIVTGITGQDGAYLAEFLLNKNYKVIGTYRRASSVNFWRINELGIKDHLNLTLVKYDLTDLGGSIRLIEKFNPDEIYNLAAQSFVEESFQHPVATAEINALGPVNLLEAIRHLNSRIRYYQASTSELFGKVQENPQNELSLFYPRSPYGVAKLYAHWMTINYRESYNIFASNGILFNHESPLRGIEFVTRKITDAVAKIKLGMLDYIELGNSESRRDWGFAKEYVEGMWLMLQARNPDNYVLATGKSETIKNFVSLAFNAVDIDIKFSGKGKDTIGINSKTNKTILKINPIFYRPSEVDLLTGDPSKAKEELGWESKISLDELVTMMVDADLRRNQSDHVY